MISLSQAPASNSAPSISDASGKFAPIETANDAKQFEEEINSKRAELGKELDVLKKSMQVSSATSPPGFLENLNKQISLLQQIDLAYNQQISAIQQTASLEAQKKQLEEEEQKVRESTPPEQASYLELDQLRDSINAEISRKDIIEARIQSAQSGYEQAQKTFDEKESMRRQSKDQYDKIPDEAAKQSLVMPLQMARLESRAAGEALRLHELELRNERLVRSVYQAQLEVLNLRVQLTENVAVFTQQELQDKLQRMDKDEFDLQTALKKAVDDKKLADNKLAVLLSKIAQVPEPDRALSEEKAARERETYALQTKIDVITLRLERMAKRRIAWQKRFTVLNQEADLDQLKTWEKETDDILANLAREENLLKLRISDRQTELTNLQNTIDNSRGEPQQVIRWLDEQKKQLQDTINTLQENITNIELNRRHQTKLLNAIKEQTTHLTIWDRLQEGFESIASLWNKEIYVYQQGEIERAYYVKTIFYAFFFFAAGLILSRFLSRFIGRFLLHRLKVQEGASTTIESLIHYILLILFFLYTLRILQVPLTFFTIFGGAFAIAIGFGSQNILNNFISGLILLVERPVRVGDLVEIEGTIGRVTRMAARCTHIRTFTNLDIVVPNSSFLEKKFTNWTLIDNIIRSDINLGIAYGSSTEKTEQILLAIAHEHPQILKEPEPVCFFMEFGDSALNFELRYWVNMAASNKLRIDSQIRHAIHKRFGEAGITLAFPQRDIHMDNIKPLDVRIFSQIERE
ncbi:MAG: mechanosensitive ion channel [Candidatus Omnitrophica bacterium]|nr:mechanosensitive ion channel [Candidatus Omnitrophota bacterium]